MAAPSVVLPQGEREREREKVSETQRGRQSANRSSATGEHDENTWNFREGGKKNSKTWIRPAGLSSFSFAGKCPAKCGSFPGLNCQLFSSTS